MGESPLNFWPIFATYIMKANLASTSFKLTFDNHEAGTEPKSQVALNLVELMFHRDPYTCGVPVVIICRTPGLYSSVSLRFRFGTA